MFVAMRTLSSSWAAHRRHHAPSLPAYDACNIVVDFVYLLRGARCFHDLLCAARPSHNDNADNFIGEAGCIALSSSLVHLSHLKVLDLKCKPVVNSRALDVVWGSLLILCCWLGDILVRVGRGSMIFRAFVLLFAWGNAMCVVISSTTLPLACTMISDVHTYWILLLIIYFLLPGANSFDLCLCTSHPSHIAGNYIGDAGCIALSSSLVHLSHLKVLGLKCKPIVYSRALAVVWGSLLILCVWLGDI